MIDKVIRTYSEKTTSVDQEIEVVQYMTLGVSIKRAKYAIVIPTNVKEVKAVNLTPLNVSSALYLHDSWYASFTFLEATNAAVSAALIKSASVDDDLYTVPGKDFLRIYGRNLYISQASMTSTNAASASLITGSESLWKKVESIGSNAKKYFTVTPHLATTASYANLRFAIEVRGYGIAE